MATAQQNNMKVTYTMSAADMEQIHQAFDQALKKVLAECGKEYPVQVEEK